MEKWQLLDWKKPCGPDRVNKLVNVQSGLKNVKRNVDDLDVHKLKTVPMDLEKNKWCSE